MGQSQVAGWGDNYLEAWLALEDPSWRMRIHEECSFTYCIFQVSTQFFGLLELLHDMTLASSRESGPKEQGGSRNVSSGLAPEVIHYKCCHILVSQGRVLIQYGRESCKGTNTGRWGLWDQLGGWLLPRRVYFWTDGKITNKLIDLVRKKKSW